MHVMFIHPNFPAQFGHIAAHLTTQLGWKCTFVTSIDTTQLQLPFDHINYRVHEGPRHGVNEAEVPEVLAAAAANDPIARARTNGVHV